MPNLETNYMGLMLRNPFIAGSCGLTSTPSGVSALAKHGIGAVVVKSIFEEQIFAEAELYIGSGKPGTETYSDPPKTILDRRIHDEDEVQAYVYNYARTHTLARYLDSITQMCRETEVPVIASINCVTGYDWQSFARNIEQAGAHALELNIYILPSDLRSEDGSPEVVYENIIDAVRSFVNIPVAVKTGYYFSALTRSMIRLSESGIGGLVLFNRPYCPDIDIEKIEVSTGNVLSSPGEYGQTLRWISLLSDLVKCDLSAATGIHDSETAVKMLLAGATTVQLASLLYRNGPEAIPSMIEGLVRWMGRHGYERPDDFRGKLSRKNLSNPASMERVQFMKLYSGIE